VDAALAIADEEGLEALSIRRLAKEVGVTPMAIYWHVADKEALLEALGERLFCEVRLPAHGGEWHEELSAILATLLGVLREHPAVAPLAMVTVLSSEPGLALAERVLFLLSEAGLDERAASDAGVYLLSSIVTLVTVEPGNQPTADREAHERKMELKRERLARVPADRFPTVARLAGALLDCDDPDAYYRRGLELLVLGLRGLVSAR
jgi:AcrR family transcriptional regulator